MSGLRNRAFFAFPIYLHHSRGIDLIVDGGMTRLYAGRN